MGYGTDRLYLFAEMKRLMVLCFRIAIKRRGFPIPRSRRRWEEAIN